MSNRKSSSSITFVFLILSLLILAGSLISTKAWFTTNNIIEVEQSLELGSVDVAASNTITLSAKANIYPGDTIDYSFEIYNSGNVGQYFMLGNSSFRFVYSTNGDYLTGVDITELILPYVEFTYPTSSATPLGDTYNIYTLSANATQGSGVTYTGSIKFKGELPNTLSSYEIIGSQNIHIVLDTIIGSMQNVNVPNTIVVLDNLQYIVGYRLIGEGTDDITLTYRKQLVENVVAAWQVGLDPQKDNVILYLTRNEEDNTKYDAHLVGLGQMKQFSVESRPWDNYKSVIKLLTVENGVKNIGNNAFTQHPYLVELNLGFDIETIGETAFNGCIGLKEVVLPQSVTTISTSAFYYCRGLVSIVLSDNVQYIGGYAFTNCDNLKKITIPKSVKYIGSNVFNNCSALTDIYMEHTSSSEITTLDANWLGNCGARIWWYSETEKNNCWSWQNGRVTPWPDSYEIIGDEGIGATLVYGNQTIDCVGAWYNGADADGKNIVAYLTTTDGGEPYTLHMVGQGAMKDRNDSTIGDWSKSSLGYNSKITSLEIDNKITTIGNNAFVYLSGLTEITLPNRLATIGQYAFKSCTNLTKVKLPEDLITLSTGAFHGCTSLEYIVIEGIVETIGTNIFNSCTNLEYLFLEEFDRQSTPYDPTLLRVGNNAEIVYYSLSQKSGHWHMVNEVPTLWESYKITVNASDASKSVVTLNGETLNTAYAWDVSAKQNGKVILYLTQVGSNYKANLVGIGATKDYYAAADRPYHDYRANIVNLTINEGITYLGRYLFNAFAITTVTIPSTVQTFRDAIFQNCTVLKSVNFAGNSSLTTIYGNAFNFCEKLESFTVPKSVTGIINNFLSYCTSLTSLTVETGNTVFYSENNCIMLTSTKALIEGCKTSIIPNNVTKIGMYAFYNKVTKDLLIPASVTSIDSCAFGYVKTNLFMGHTSSSALTFASNWNNNGSATVYYYSETKQAGFWHYVNGVPTLWNTITDPGVGATITLNGQAQSCYAAWDVSLDNTGDAILYLTQNASDSTKYDAYLVGSGATKDYSSSGDRPYNSYCTSIVNLTINEGITELGQYFFFNFRMTKVSLPSTVHTLKTACFQQCYSLNKITLNNGLTTVGNYAIDQTAITSIHFPSTVTSWSGYALRISDSLQSITVDTRNTVYYSQNNCMIESATKTLVVGCFKSTIPNDIKIIGHSAFWQKAPEDLIIPSSVKTINWGSFGRATCNLFMEATSSTGITFANEWNYNGSLNVFYYSATEKAGHWRYVNGVPTVWGTYAISGTDGESASVTLGGVTLATSAAYNVSATASDNAILYLTGASSNLTARIVGTGNMKNFAASESPVYNNKNIKTVIVDGVNNLGTYTFNDCSGITEVVLGDSLQTLGNNAFRNCTFTSLHIPKNVSSLNGTIVNACIYITTLTVDPQNTTYYSSGNCIINRASQNLVAGTFTSVIPEGVKSIQTNAFCYTMYDAPTYIIIPESINTIAANAFNTARYIEYFYLRDTSPSGITLTDGFVSYNTVYKVAYYSLETPTNASYTYWHYVDDVPTIWTDYSVTEGYSIKGEGAGAKVYLDGVEISGVTAAWNASATSNDNVIVYYISSLGRMVAAGTGNMKDYESRDIYDETSGYTRNMTTAPWATYVNDVRTIEVKEGVTSLGDYAFYSWAIYGEDESWKYTSVILPESLIIKSHSIWGTFTYSSGDANVYVYVQAGDASGITGLSNIFATSGNVITYYYSETSQSGCWHYDTDGITPVLW